MKMMDAWGELSGFILLLVGLVLSLVIDAAVVSYAIILFSGIIIGRLYRMKIHKQSIVFYVVTIGFLLGYLLGAIINQRGNILVIILFFAIGCWYGNYIMKKKLCK